MLIVMWCWTMKTWLTNSRERLVCPVCISICAHVRSKPLYDRLIAGSLYFPQLWFNLRAFPLFRRCLSWKVKRKKKRKNQGKNSLLARHAELWNWGGTHFWCAPSQSSMRLASHHFFFLADFFWTRVTRFTEKGVHKVYPWLAVLFSLVLVFRHWIEEHFRKRRREDIKTLFSFSSF